MTTVFTSAAHFCKAGRKLKDFGLVAFVLTLLILNLIVLTLSTALATPVVLSAIVPNPEEQKKSIQLICTAGSTALNNLLVCHVDWIPSTSATVCYGIHCNHSTLHTPKELQKTTTLIMHT